MNVRNGDALRISAFGKIPFKLPGRFRGCSGSRAMTISGWLADCMDLLDLSEFVLSKHSSSADNSQHQLEYP